MALPLYDRIGGERVVRATVSKMCDKILGDPKLAPFFDNVGIDVLRHSQSAFVTYAFGGMNHYNGKAMHSSQQGAAAHVLTDLHFDLVTGHLAAAMQELRVAEEWIAEALVIAGSSRTKIKST